MMHVISRLFNKFSFIFIQTLMFCYKYAILNIVTKSINLSLRVSLSFSSI